MATTAPVNDGAMHPSPLSRRRFGYWLAGSVLVHLLFLLSGNSSSLFHGHRETVLSITLDGDKQLPAPVRRAEKPADANPASPKPETAVGATSASTTATPSTSHATPPAPVSEGQGQSHQAAAARIRTSLLADLARHFDYPLLARRRGWEGTVLIGLDVEADGWLREVHLARSSGYDLLDQSALDAVRRVGRLRDTSSWPGGGRLHLRLPVIYRLTDH